jgi:DNA (cytosine-5)-methyltransferase 1
MKAAYYNERDPFRCDWLRNLIQRGLIEGGEVDGRPVEDVDPSDLRGFKRCHFFAGLGGWAFALSLAGWPADAECWTGSPPCKSLSRAGKRTGRADPRHVWPVWFPLIRQLRPATIFVEQSDRAVCLGWLDEVAADLEREGYACGAAVLPASAVGAPHIRERLWVTADLNQPPLGLAKPRQERLPWPAQPAARVMAHGFPARYDIVSALGDSLVVPVAASFVEAYIEARSAR